MCPGASTRDGACDHRQDTERCGPRGAARAHAYDAQAPAPIEAWQATRARAPEHCAPVLKLCRVAQHLHAP
eukprot:3675317-Alexandrium_andersonii.AAC.1